MQRTIIISATIIATGIAVGLIFSGKKGQIQDAAEPRGNSSQSPSPRVGPGSTETSSSAAVHSTRAAVSPNATEQRRTRSINWRGVRKGVEAGWAEPLNISKNSGNSASPSLAVDGKGIYVAWHDNSSGHYEILASRRSKGEGWSKPVNISKSKDISVSPTLAIDKRGAIHVVWAGATNGVKDLFYSKSADGESWSEPVDISNDRTRSSYYPSIVVDRESNLHVVSNDTEEHESDVFYRANISGSWSRVARKISKREEDSMGAFIPRIGIDSKEDLFVLCHYFAAKATEIDCIEREAGRQEWSVTNVSQTAPGARDFNPAIAIDENDVVHVVWDAKLSKESPSQVFYSRKKGGAWLKAVAISNTPEDATNPSVAVGGGYLYVAWTQKMADRKEVFYTRYTQSVGETSTEGLVNISSSVNNSVSPRISVAGNDVGLVWSEIVGTQADIYYSTTVNRAPAN